LRELADTDLAAVQAYAADPAVVRFLPWGPNTEEHTRQFLATIRAARETTPRVQWDLGAVLKTDRTLIGACRLHVTDPNAGEADVGYALARRHWGHGYAAEAVRALVGFAFERLGARRVWAVCEPANRASLRVLDKAGLRRERFLRAHRFMKGSWRDSYVYACYNEHP
jgi:[ribosomal protein S5]-alanine N-acetyltransferase